MQVVHKPHYNYNWCEREVIAKMPTTEHGSEVEQLVKLSNYTLMPEEALLIVANGYATMEHWLALTVPEMMAVGVEFNQAKKIKSLLTTVRETKRCTSCKGTLPSQAFTHGKLTCNKCLSKKRKHATKEDDLKRENSRLHKDTEQLQTSTEQLQKENAQLQKQNAQLQDNNAQLKEQTRMLHALLRLHPVGQRHPKVKKDDNSMGSMEPSIEQPSIAPSMGSQGTLSGSDSGDGASGTVEKQNPLQHILLEHPSNGCEVFNDSTHQFLAEMYVDSLGDLCPISTEGSTEAQLPQYAGNVPQHWPQNDMSDFAGIVDCTGAPIPLDIFGPRIDVEALWTSNADITVMPTNSLDDAALWASSVVERSLPDVSWGHPDVKERAAMGHSDPRLELDDMTERHMISCSKPGTGSGAGGGGAGSAGSGQKSTVDDEQIIVCSEQIEAQAESCVGTYEAVFGFGDNDLEGRYQLWSDKSRSNGIFGLALAMLIRACWQLYVGFANYHSQMIPTLMIVGAAGISRYTHIRCCSCAIATLLAVIWAFNVHIQMHATELQAPFVVANTAIGTALGSLVAKSFLDIPIVPLIGATFVTQLQFWCSPQFLQTGDSSWSAPMVRVVACTLWLSMILVQFDLRSRRFFKSLESCSS